MGFTPVTYDNEERLTAWSRSDGNQGQTWSLSLVGDWTTHAQTGTVAFTQNRVHGPAHEFTSFTGTASGTLTYDSKGNNTARPATLASPALNLTWDFGNQLSGVDTNGTPASQEVTFRYDVLGRRVGRVEGGSSIVFVQAGQQTVADYDAGQIPGKPNHVYVFGSYIDEPIARRESANIAYFHRNQQYSIVAISNSSGAVIERYSYTAHGQLSIYNAAGTVLSASAFDNRFTYTGREWDATLALHYFRARWYDPLAGRFISRDRLGYVDGMSLYRVYIGLNGLDPSGHNFLCVCTCIPTHPFAAEEEHLAQVPDETACIKHCNSIAACSYTDRLTNKFHTCTHKVACYDPVCLIVYAYIWAGSNANEESISADIEKANEVFRKCCVQFHLVIVRNVSRQPPDPIILDENLSNPVVHEIDEQGVEIQVHYMKWHHIGHGIKVYGAIFRFNDGPRLTLAHELGHYLHLEHLGHVRGDLMASGAVGIGHNLTELDCETAHDQANEVKRRQDAHESPPKLYQHPGELRPPSGARIGKPR